MTATVRPLLQPAPQTSPSPAPPEAWRQHAACRDWPTATFYPDGELGEIMQMIHQAKRICQGCPVADECLEEAMAGCERHGIWGGLTERERRKKRRREGLRGLNVRTFYVG